jgi:RNA polymerase sigma-70 factor (ECF subfamily)
MTFQPRPSPSDLLASRTGAGGDPDLAFAHEILELRPALCAFAFRLTRRGSDAEDLVQDTILRALVAKRRFEEGTNLKAWLFTILRNAFNTRWRRLRRETLPGDDAIAASAVTSATQVDSLWARETIHKLLHDLSPAHREVLILIPVLGLGYEDAAEVCGCSVGTVKSRLNRARAALSALVDDEEP